MNNRDSALAFSFKDRSPVRSFRPLFGVSAAQAPWVFKSRRLLNWYSLMAELGFAWGQIELACRFWDNADWSAALRFCRLAVEQGNARARYLLGCAYLNGTGVRQNDTEAANWFRLAAEKGVAAASGDLGYLYLIGKGVSQDYREAQKWYDLAAEQNHAQASLRIDVMSSLGKHIPKDEIATEERLGRVPDQLLDELSNTVLAEASSKRRKLFSGGLGHTGL
ncbi:MAG: tetratricopeptide repeat protein [Gammaproteobacteria bacterium]|nr:tetratricopeptide repeat protein [Gammaproteobacteria bacterium]